MNIASILLLTDNLEMQQFWSEILRKKGFNVAISGLSDNPFPPQLSQTCNIILIDIEASLSGQIAKIRSLSTETEIPILLMSPTADLTEILHVYQAGISDYIAKPVDHRLIIAKISAWLNQIHKQAIDVSEKLQLNTILLDPVERQVSIKGRIIKLTYLEYRLLYFLMKHPNQILNPQLIVRFVWGDSDGAEGNLLKNAIYRLRQKIEVDPSQPCHIISLRGEGYMFQIDL